MHVFSASDSLLNSFGGIDMPDTVGVVEAQDGCRDREERYESPAACDGEVNYALALFEAANKFVHRVQCAVCTGFIDDVDKGLSIVSQDMSAKMDDASISFITITGKFGDQAFD
jgi:hypothetical protein